MNRVACAGLVFLALSATASAQTPIAGQQSDWSWGELIYGRTYRGEITLQNQCTTEQTVLIGTERAPELEIDRFVRLPPRTVVKVPYLIAPRHIEGRLMNDEIRGEVVIWHSRDAASNCPAYRLVRRVSGRARMPELRDAGREAAAADDAALTGVCRVWWIRGSNPAPMLSKAKVGDAVQTALTTVNESQCAPIARSSARLLRQNVLGELAPLQPSAWNWMPTDTIIDRSSMADLVAFRRRVVDQLRR